MHALIINGLFGLGFSAVFLLLGPQIYRAMGGAGGIAGRSAALFRRRVRAATCWSG